MFKLLRTCFPMIGVALFSGCATSAPTINTPIRQGPAVGAPAYKNGDQWTYQIVRSTGNNEQIQISYRNGKFEHDNQNIFDGAIWVNVYRADTDLEPLSFPLSSGKSWSYRYRATSPAGRTIWREAAVKVIGPTAQPITTKAGKFKVIEIERMEILGAAQRKTTYFYSPDARCVVKLLANNITRNERYEMELVKYSSGR